MRCTICFEEVIGRGVGPGCAHIFHANCLEEWRNHDPVVEGDNDFRDARIQTNRRCPVCRHPIPVDLIQLFVVGMEPVQEAQQLTLLAQQLARHAEGRAEAAEVREREAAERAEAAEGREREAVERAEQLERRALQAEHRAAAAEQREREESDRAREAEQRALDAERRVMEVEARANERIGGVGNGMDQEEVEEEGEVAVFGSFLGQWKPPRSCMVCIVCGRTFQSTAAKTLHMRSHAPNTNQCASCPRSYSHRGSLIRHCRSTGHNPA